MIFWRSWEHMMSWRSALSYGEQTLFLREIFKRIPRKWRNHKPQGPRLFHGRFSFNIKWLLAKPFIQSIGWEELRPKKQEVKRNRFNCLWPGLTSPSPPPSSHSPKNRFPFFRSWHVLFGSSSSSSSCSKKREVSVSFKRKVPKKKKKAKKCMRKTTCIHLLCIIFGQLLSEERRPSCRNVIFDRTIARESETTLKF